MSENIGHIKYGSVGLGCCENLYYTTYDQLKKELRGQRINPEICNLRITSIQSTLSDTASPSRMRITKNCLEVTKILSEGFK